MCEEDDGVMNNEARNDEVEIKDLDLMEYIDGENVIKKGEGNKVVTLEDVFREAYELYLAVVEVKDKQKVWAKGVK